MKCKNCWHIDHTGYCDKVMRCPDREYEWKCEHYSPINRAECIRRMTDEEMSAFLRHSICAAKADCNYCIARNYCNEESSFEDYLGDIPEPDREDKDE